MNFEKLCTIIGQLRGSNILAMLYYILAIAATLLATELPKPEAETGLLREIVKQWPHYAAFAASFLFICIAWPNHHNMFIYI